MDKRKCTARSKQSQVQCKNWAIPGALVCGKHGGKAPQVQAKAAERVLEAEVRGQLARLDVAPIGDPFSALAKLAGEVVAWKDAFAARVNHLTGGGCEHCGAGGAGELRYEASGAGTEQLRSEVVVFERGMDRCIALLGLIAKLDIDARLARISEMQADAVVRAVDAGLAAAGVTGPAAVLARQATARELRAS